MIPVSFPIEVDLERFYEDVKNIYEKRYLTNDGPYVKKLEQWMLSKLGLNYCKLVSNGTHALEVVLKTLPRGEIITTPFTYTATVNAILNAGHRVKFVDIKPSDGTIDEEQIEAAIGLDTVAIVGVHVYGNPCAVHEIGKIATKRNLKIIYDSSHSFGSRLAGKSMLLYGDFSATSLHATKVFNTCEGGLIHCNKLEEKNIISRITNFGNIFTGGQMQSGSNYKLSEIHAAWGLAQRSNFKQALATREKNTKYFSDRLVSKSVELFNRVSDDEFEANYSYLVVKFEDEKMVSFVQEKLKNLGVQTRRYFYPALNKVFTLENTFSDLLNAEYLSETILCLPNHTNINCNILDEILKVINETSKH